MRRRWTPTGDNAVIVYAYDARCLMGRYQAFFWGLLFIDCTWNFQLVWGDWEGEGDGNEASFIEKIYRGDESKLRFVEMERDGHFVRKMVKRDEFTFGSLMNISESMGNGSWCLGPFYIVVTFLYKKG